MTTFLAPAFSLLAISGAPSTAPDANIWYILFGVAVVVITGLLAAVMRMDNRGVKQGQLALADKFEDFRLMVGSRMDKTDGAVEKNDANIGAIDRRVTSLEVKCNTIHGGAGLGSHQTGH